MELPVENALQRAVAAHKEGKLQEAERLYRAILQSQPSHPDANHNLGLLAVSVNKAETALPFFRKAIEANPKIEQFWLSYIETLIKVRQIENAKQAIQQGRHQGLNEEILKPLEAQLPPTTQERTGNSPGPSQQQISNLFDHFQKGRFSESEMLAISITKEFPQHQVGWKALGAIYGQAGKISESLVPNQKSAQIAPHDAQAHYNLGNTFKKLDRLAEAEASYREAIALKPDFAVAYYNLGNTYRELGKFTEAAANYNQTIALKPDHAQAHSNLGATLHELGRLDEALASYNQAIALKPDYAEAHSDLGNTLKELGRLDEAEEKFKNAIELNAELRTAKAGLGKVLMLKGQHKEGLDFIRQGEGAMSLTSEGWSLIA